MSESIHDSAALYALDALETEERFEFEAHLASCEHCQAEVAEFEASAASLGELLDTSPPATLKASVMETIASIPQSEAPASSSTDSPAPRSSSESNIGMAPALDQSSAETSSNVISLDSFRRSRVLQFAAAAAIALIVGVTGSMYLGNTTSQFDIVASASDAATIELSGSGDGILIVAWSAELDTYAITGEDLPAIGDDKTYELWVISDGDPIPAGLFAPDDDGSLDFAGTLPEDPAVWAVTVEPAGGSDAPTSDILYLAEV